MATLNTVEPKPSVATVVVATETARAPVPTGAVATDAARAPVATVVVPTDTVAMQQHMAISLLHPTHRLRASVGPITLTPSCVGTRHRCSGCPGPSCQIPRRSKSAAAKWSCQSPVAISGTPVSTAGALIRHRLGCPLSSGVSRRQSATTQTCFRGFGAQRCITPPMKNVLLSQQSTGPNPALKRNANSAPRRPSSAGPSAQFALAVQRATLLASA